MVGYRVGLAVALCTLTGGFYLGNHQAASAAALPQTQVAQANTSAAPSGGTMDQRLDSLQKELDQLKVQQQQQQLLNQQRQQIENLQQKQTLQQQQIEKLQRENARNSGSPMPAATANAAPGQQGNGGSFKGYFPAFTMWQPGDSKDPPGYDKDQDQASREGW